MYKKAWYTCKVVVLRNKPIAFLTSGLPSPSSLLKLPGWFRTGTSIDDGARNSKNWLDQWLSDKLGTGSRVYSFPRAFLSSNDVPVLLLNQPNMWICQHYQEITHYIWFYDESVFWEQRFVQWLANVISLSIIGYANDMLIKPLKLNECTKRHTILQEKYVQLKIN